MLPIPFNRVVAFFRGRGFNKDAVGALLILLIVVISVPRTATAVYKTYVIDADNSVQQAADFLNSQTRAGALIETYDSELFFLLNRPYHYPPDQILVDLIRRTFLYKDNTDRLRPAGGEPRLSYRWPPQQAVATLRSCCKSRSISLTAKLQTLSDL